jgi:hypothetical protein
MASNSFPTATHPAAGFPQADEKFRGTVGNTAGPMRRIISHRNRFEAVCRLGDMHEANLQSHAGKVPLGCVSLAEELLHFGKANLNLAPGQSAVLPYPLCVLRALCVRQTKFNSITPANAQPGFTIRKATDFH